MIYRAAVAGAAVLALIGAGPGIGADTLRSVAATYYAKAGRISTVTGRDTTMDYYQRLLDDADLLAAPRPASYPPQAWQDSVQAIARLDLSLATQLLSQSYQEMPAIRGLGETLVRSSLDGTLQPVAVYSKKAVDEADSFIKTGKTGAASEKQLFDCTLITKDNIDDFKPEW